MKKLGQIALITFIASGVSGCGERTSIASTVPTLDTSAARSPQGIPNDADARREKVRGPRSLGQFPDPLIIGDVEMRTFDGTSNNIGHVTWGATFSHLQRLGAATYSDGVWSMIFTNRAGPRAISNTIVSQEDGQSIPNIKGTSDFTWQWGQFIDHDIDLTDGSTNESQNIPIPTGDAYFDPTGTGTAQMAFNRALYDPETGTDVTNVRQQENEITSWIDGSMIYGSDDARAAALRDVVDSALLKTSAGNLLPFNTESLTNANGPVRDPTTLFLAGDVRVNEQASLAVLHTLFVREHNRLVTFLRSADPAASAETIYHTARRLVIAEIQIITYDEFLPALLGPNAIPAYSGYDSSINPTIFTEFSAAAYRLGHSMVSDRFLRHNVHGESIPEGLLELKDAFFTAPQILRAENDIDPILRGLATQTHQLIDVKVVNSLRNFLFDGPTAGGFDLTALNIQRGRDHGLPTYNNARTAMGLSRVSAFSQISTDMELQQSLQDAYGDVSHIDLWVGGLAETPMSSVGSQLGELFYSIVVKQFTDLRDGDRFWYERDLNGTELDIVRNVTLATVIRNNTNIGPELQDNVFFVSQ
jgi:peroxidase